MNSLRIAGLAKFTAIFNVCWLAASVCLGAGAPVTVQISPNGSYGLVNPNYNGKSLVAGKTYSMTAYARPGFGFAGWTGSAATIKTKLTFVAAPGQDFTANFVDKQKPALAIATPANGSVLMDSGLVVTGTTHDNVAVTNVFYNFHGLGWTAAGTGNNFKNWYVNLALFPGTNSFLAYAVDSSGNFSATNKLKIIYSVSPTNLAGSIISVVSNNYAISFSAGTNHTFSDETGVGTYAYAKTGPLAGKLTLHYIAPPSASNTDVVILQFTDGADGTFSDKDDFTNSFMLSPATNLASAVLSGANIVFNSADGMNSALFTFLSTPNIASGGSQFVTANPVNIPLDAPYLGNIGDRVKVTFTHLELQSGIWITAAPLTLAGTVVSISDTTNAISVLFDVPSVKSSKDVYSVLTNVPLNVQTFYSTNYFNSSEVANSAPTFIYTNYSPDGSLLKVNQHGTNIFYILTFTNDSPSGIYFAENYGTDGHFHSVDSGTFDVVQRPVITSQPQSVITTNGDTASFSVAAAGSQPLGYQWQFIDQFGDTNLLVDSGGISGSTTTNLTISSVLTNQLGTYQVIVTNAFGSAISIAAKLSFAPVILVPQITSQPQPQSVTNGGIAVFQVSVTSSTTPSYQWQLNGTNLIIFPPYAESDLNASSALQINPVLTNNLGNYRVIVANSFGSVTSSPAALTFTITPPTP